MSYEDLLNDLNIAPELTIDNELQYNILTYCEPMLRRAYNAGHSDGIMQGYKNCYNNFIGDWK